MQWSEPAPYGCEYYIPLTGDLATKSKDRNLAIFAEAMRWLEGNADRVGEDV